MTDNVIISISGIQYEVSGNEPIEVICRGTYFCQNGCHIIEYEELPEIPELSAGVYENGEESSYEATFSNCRIIFDDTRAELIKTGIVTTTMIFSKDQASSSFYHTPFGEFCVEIDTSRLSLSVTDDLIELSLSYNLRLNYQQLSECLLTVKITPDDSH